MRPSSVSATRFDPRFAYFFDNLEEAKLVCMSGLTVRQVIWRDPALVVLDALPGVRGTVREWIAHELISAWLLLTHSLALGFQNARCLMGPSTDLLRPGLECRWRAESEETGASARCLAKRNWRPAHEAFFKAAHLRRALRPFAQRLRDRTI
jgi:hypothetical protein